MKLVLHRVSVARGSRMVISDLSLTVATGEAVVLTGANGAGKTTLIRSIAGLIQPAAGTIALDGGNSELDLPQQCHYAGHANAIKASLTVEENLRFWGQYLSPQAGASDAFAGHALDALNLTGLASVPAAYLSAGQKRRVGLARLIIAKRPVWLLDEPTASLDTASAVLVAQLVNAHTASGGLAVVATHLPIGLNAARLLHLTGAGGAEAA